MWTLRIRHSLRRSFTQRSAVTAVAGLTTSNTPHVSDVLPVFPGLPESVSLGNLPKPEMKLSTLSNGLRIGSQETYGQLCNFGVIFLYV